MQAGDRDGAGSDAASGAAPGDRTPTDNVLDRLAREHAVQLELCEVLELIADGLPHRIDETLVRRATSVLSRGLSAHFRFEEDVLFPLLRRRASGDASLIAALDQLENEHVRDWDLCEELAEELRSVGAKGRARNVEMLGYMLRGYFEGQRRHIEWENTIVLPAARRVLTATDLASIAARLPRSDPTARALLAERGNPR